MLRWTLRIAVALAGALALLVAYGVLVEPRLILDEEHLDVPLPGLVTAADGTEVGVVTDLQIGMWWSNTGMVERAVERIVDADPDMALLGGDYVYSSDPSIPEQVAGVMELLDPLVESGIPTFAVLGNHDYAVGAAEELTTAFEEAGITMLRNEAAPVPGTGTGAQALHVVGIGPVVPGEVDVEAALSGVPDDAPRIVLSHNPTAFPEFPAGTAPLALAGHTHCGQIALPGTPTWSYLALTDEEKIVAKGWAPEEYGAEGNRMFVTCGIGFSLVPMRINAPPEVAFFELRPGD
ncbi:metallophosphoesterase [Blastococcus sp. HT6-30]|uniref:metallophosphoesterase n=1 Tax=Blastococcus sp. HT6-30 TaxID=3144843 RepID=UPI0032194179